MDAAISGEPDIAVVTYFTLKHAACYAFISCMFLVLYDSVLTFGQEVELIWHSAFSIPALVYFISRYSSFAFALVWLLTRISGDPTATRCMALYQLSAWHTWVSNLLVHLAVQVWLYAVFNKNRRLMYGLGTVFVVVTCLQFSACLLTMLNLRVIRVSPVCVTIQDNVSHKLSLKETLSDAAAMKMPTFLVITILVSMAFSVFLISLLAYKAFVTYRPRPTHAPDIAAVLIRDSFIYCFVIVFVAVYNSLLITIAPSEIVQAGVGFEIALPTIASSRLLLNLRAADKRRERRTDVEGILVDQWETMFYIT